MKVAHKTTSQTSIIIHTSASCHVEPAVNTSMLTDTYQSTADCAESWGTGETVYQSHQRNQSDMSSDISVTETITETEIVDPALTETMLIYETEII